MVCEKLLTHTLAGYAVAFYEFAVIILIKINSKKQYRVIICTYDPKNHETDHVQIHFFLSPHRLDYVIRRRR